MLSWFLRIVAVLLLIRALWRFLAGVAGKTKKSGRFDKAQKSVRLVRDPVCGTYVPRMRALTIGQGNGAQFFCSERCRTSYQNSTRV